MNFAKIVKSDLNSPRRELSDGGLGIFVAFMVFRQLMFCVFLLGVQSSCMVSSAVISLHPPAASSATSYPAVIPWERFMFLASCGLICNNLPQGHPRSRDHGDSAMVVFAATFVGQRPPRPLCGLVCNSLPRSAPGAIAPSPPCPCTRDRVIGCRRRVPPSTPRWLATQQQSRDCYKGRRTFAMPPWVQETAEEGSARGGKYDI